MVNALVKVEELDSMKNAPLRFALLRYGGEDEYPRMLLYLSFWVHFLLEPCFYTPDRKRIPFLDSQGSKVNFFFTLIQSTIAEKKFEPIVI